MENSVDPDQLASSEASWSGSSLFSKDDTEWNWILNIWIIHFLLQGWVSASDSVKRESFTVEKLRPNTTYMFLIRAKNAQGVGLPSLVSDPVTTASKSIPPSLGASFCLFDLILYLPPTIFQLYRDGSSWVEPVLS